MAAFCNHLFFNILILIKNRNFYIQTRHIEKLDEISVLQLHLLPGVPWNLQSHQIQL